MFLYEELDNLRKYRAIQPLPPCIRDSLNPRMPLRPYQEAAFENFVTYFQRPGGPKRPCQVLFHMATGSGKTLIMAGLIAYLYQQGYRNFLFFVNLTTIVQQTRDIFLNPAPPNTSSRRRSLWTGIGCRSGRSPTSSPAIRRPSTSCSPPRRACTPTCGWCGKTACLWRILPRRPWCCSPTKPTT